MLGALRDQSFPVPHYPPYAIDAHQVDPTGTHIVPPRLRAVAAGAGMSPRPVPPRRGLVLAGGAAKGAFEAGALAELVHAGLHFRSIVGTSAGALNGAYFAAGVRAGREHDAAQALVQFWQRDARWKTILDVSPREIFAGRGLSTSARLEHVFRERIAPMVQLPTRQPVDLRIVTTRLQPAQSGVEAGRYEHVFTFTQDDFANGIDAITHAAVASAAFPGLFAPVNVPEVGDCMDGGFVANTPLSDGLAADEVYVIAPWAPLPGPTVELSGLSLVNRWIEVLVSERFNREVSQAQAQRRLAENQSHRTRAGQKRTPSPRIILIRPPQQLPGSLLVAFGDEGLRADYIARGRAAARAALAQVQQ